MPARKRWKSLPRAPKEFAEDIGLPKLIAQLVYNRHITRPDLIDDFFNETTAKLHNPYLLPGMGESVSRLTHAIRSEETIGVFGDFDVDGVTATAILSDGLTKLGASIAPYIPHRVSEGHGLNSEAIQALRASGTNLIITVDCGVTSHKEVLLASDLGMDVIITDHHTPPPNLPEALAVVNPKVQWSKYPFQELTGAGLAFKLIQGVYQHKGMPWPTDLLQLAALGTVADLAPLHNENRTIVREGLKGLSNSTRPGILALMRRVGRLGQPIDTETIAFGLAPRLNASGRLDHAITSYQLLTSESTIEATTLASQLEAFNQERRSLTEASYSIAKQKVSMEDDPPILVIGDESFIPGIAGLIASKLVDEFHRPAIVLSFEGDLARASARSISGFNMIEALSSCEDLFQKVGGHAMAAGFTAPRENIPEVNDRLNEIGRFALERVDLEPTLMVDAAASPSNLLGSTYEWLSKLEPHGVGNPKPIFFARSMNVLHSRTVGSEGQHLSLSLSDGQSTWKGIAFRQGDRHVHKEDTLDVIYNLTTNSFGNQNTIEMNIQDFRLSEN
ncbi:single-stranded-DNA-specific exonuclease RecJ [SAR202 cluster bacterium AD-804-J14_MRT_500m]|nr:single-stranded-DNA-specific exonuclease RecJ [SAR202 cluster bacterium AD-804-J14_MRT_500m]